MSNSEYESIIKFQNLKRLKLVNNFKKEIKISIIIYCIEFKNLKKTLISIINQDFDKYEIN